MQTDNNNTGLIELTAIRHRPDKAERYKGLMTTSIFKNGQLFAYFKPDMKQPRFGSKTITINCWKWALKWYKE